MAENELRTSSRQRTVLRGCVYYNNRSAAADCLVRDVSSRGARLELSENVVIPDLIELYIPKRQETFRARVKWRRGNDVGVAYVDSGEGQEPDHDVGNLGAPTERGHSDLEERVKKLEAEIVSLKRMIKSVHDDLNRQSARLPI